MAPPAPSDPIMRQPSVDLGEKQEPRRMISDVVDFKKKELASCAPNREQVSRCNVLEHLLLKRQVGNKTLQADILAFQVFHPLRLIDLKTAVFLASAIKTLQRYARIPAGHRRRVSLRHRYFDLAKQRYDLPRAEPLLRHNLSSFPSPFSHNAWSKKAQSGQQFIRFSNALYVNTQFVPAK